MCGQYSLTLPAEAIRQLFLFRELPNLPPRHNVRPTQEAPVVVRRDGERHLRLMRWGLVPPWAKDLSFGRRLINARAETVATMPAFRSAFRRRRCLVPADGFYEWRKEGKVKQPYHLRLRDGGAFAFAGLWEAWRPPDGERVLSFTIITTDANATVSPLHDRMPVILAPDDHERWLAPEAPDGRGLLRPCPDDWLEARPVGRLVGNPRKDGPEVPGPSAAGPAASSR